MRRADASRPTRLACMDRSSPPTATGSSSMQKRRDGPIEGRQGPGPRRQPRLVRHSAGDRIQAEGESASISDLKPVRAPGFCMAGQHSDNQRHPATGIDIDVTR